MKKIILGIILVALIISAVCFYWIQKKQPSITSVVLYWDEPEEWKDTQIVTKNGTILYKDPDDKNTFIQISPSIPKEEKFIVRNY